MIQESKVEPVRADEGGAWVGNLMHIMNEIEKCVAAALYST